MAERKGKIVKYFEANRVGEIQPDGGGEICRFYLPSVSNADPLPKRGDTVTFEAPEPRKNKQGKVVQDNANGVTIVERGPALPPPRPSAGTGGFRQGRGGDRRGGGNRGGRERSGDRRDRPSFGREGGGRRDARGERRGDLRGSRSGVDGQVVYSTDKAPELQLRSSDERPNSERRPRDNRRGEARGPRRDARGDSRRGPGDSRRNTPRGPEARNSTQTRRPLRNGGRERPTDRRNGGGNERLPGFLPRSDASASAPLRITDFHPALLRSKFIFWPNPIEGRFSFRGRNRNYFLKQVALPTFAAHQRNRFPLRELHGRKRATERALTESGYTVISKVLRAESKITVTHSDLSLIASGVPLEHTWGYPILSGHLLKGVAARGGKNLLTEEEYQQIFGTKDTRGGVIFFDALPEKRIAELEADATLNHFPSYYSGAEGKLTGEDPVERNFLAIPQGSLFRISIALKPGLPGNLAERAYEALLHGCATEGIGARKSVGYGVLREFRSEQTALKTSREPSEIIQSEGARLQDPTPASE